MRQLGVYFYKFRYKWGHPTNIQEEMRRHCDACNYS